MASSDFLPDTEPLLNLWAQNFNQKLTTTVGAYGLSAGQISAFTALFNSWSSAFIAANQNSTRTPSAIQTKRDAKAALVDGPGGIRQLVAIIQANPATTNTQRQDLQITVRDPEPSPLPVPASAPGLEILSTNDRIVNLRLQDLDNPDRRGKPDGVQGAVILTYVGDEPPGDAMQWSFFANTSRTLVQVDFPDTIPAGSKVWITCMWFNPRKQAGPPASPVSTYIASGLAATA